MNENYLKELISLEYENEYVEFKQNWFEKGKLGKYISAISNYALENGLEYGYFILGVSDKTHEIVGTSFNPNIKVNNEPLKHYLARKLNPSIAFKFENIIIDGKKIVVLIIPSARNSKILIYRLTQICYT